MTPLQFVEALEAIGISARYLGRVTGIPSGTIANWTRANTKGGFATPVPAAIADWLRRQVAHRESDPAPRMRAEPRG
jgi:hypothetical protein